MIQLTSLTKSFGERVLLDDVTWTVSDGERVGLCGPNGAGKTTLLRMLAGLDERGPGRRSARPAELTVGYLPQDGIEHSGRSLVEEASAAFQPLLDARAEIDRIEHALADPVPSRRRSTKRCSSATTTSASSSDRARGTASTCA